MARETLSQKVDRLQRDLERAEEDKKNSEQELSGLRDEIKELWAEYSEDWCSSSKTEFVARLREHGIDLEMGYWVTVRIKIKGIDGDNDIYTPGYGDSARSRLNADAARNIERGLSDLLGHDGDASDGITVTLHKDSNVTLKIAEWELDNEVEEAD